MILIIDNYDSFTYNLFQYIGGLNPDIKVFRNDALTPEEALRMAPSHVVISPGPGFPSDAGVSKAMIEALGPHIPLLGICLGHQAIGEVFGATVTHCPSGPLHGKACPIRLDPQCPVFEGLPAAIRGGRYHSLAIDPATLPASLKVTARTDDGIIMGVAHTHYPIYGIQFHPESVLTEYGRDIIGNFLKIGAQVFC